MKKSRRPSSEGASLQQSNRSLAGADQKSESEEIRGRIAARAYALYEERGSQDGYDLEDWLTAEREVLNGGR